MLLFVRTIKRPIFWHAGRQWTNQGIEIEWPEDRLEELQVPQLFVCPADQKPQPLVPATSAAPTSSSNEAELLARIAQLEGENQELRAHVEDLVTQLEEATKPADKKKK